MKRNEISNIVLIISLLFTSCINRENSRYLGKLSENDLGISFKLYQEDEFESSVGIYYEITDNQDKIISPMTLLIGTSDFDRRDTKDFFISAYDSITYIGFKSDTTVIHKMYDLKSKRTCCEYSTDDSAFTNQLLDRLKAKNKNLRLY